MAKLWRVAALVGVVLAASCGGNQSGGDPVNGVGGTASPSSTSATGGSTVGSGGASDFGGSNGSGGTRASGGTFGSGGSGGSRSSGGSSGSGGSRASGGSGVGGNGGAAGQTTGGTAQGGASSQPSNTKRSAAYSKGEVFLVSDADWRVVLSLVPAAVWQAATDAEYAACPHPYGGAGRACAIPTLVFHQQSNGSDLDASVHFLDRYSPSKISYSGTLPTDASSLLSSRFTLAAAPTPLSYWSSWKTAVHVANDYPLALVASVLASIENAPLLIQGFNDNIDLSGKTLLCVGLSGASCSVSYATALDVERRIANLASTDKLLLTVPSDITTPSVVSTQPIKFEQTTGTLGTIYAGYSLAAPFLASAKLEVLLPYVDADRSYQAINSYISSATTTIPITPSYLTIVASPTQVPAARDDYCALSRFNPGCTPTTWTQVDGAIYGDLDGDYFQDIAVGRLGGFSVSDVSAYVASDLFYDRLPNSTEYLNLQSFTDYPGSATDALQFVARAFSLAGLTGTTSTATLDHTFPPALFGNRRVIFYAGHGYWGGGNNGFDTSTLRKQHIWFQSSIVGAYGCSTCANDRLAPEDQSILFCNDVMRRGALAYVGAVDDDSSNSVVAMDWLRYLAKGEDLGTAFKHASNLAIADYVLAYSPYNTLLGDPTFSPAFVPTSDVDLAHVSVAGPSTPVGGRVTQTVTVTLDPTTTQSYTDLFDPDTTFTITTGPSFAGDYVERSGVSYLRFLPGPNSTYPPLDAAGETFYLSVAVPNPTKRAFVRVSHAQRVVAGKTVDMTASTIAQRMLDVAGASYFYIGFNELGPSGSPLVPVTPYTTPAVTLTVDLEFQQ
jgi:hypothetical protein